MEPVIFHHPLNTGERPVEFLLGVEFTELQASRTGQLIRRRVVRDSLDCDRTYEKISGRKKAQSDASSFGAVRLGLNVGEAARGKKRLHRVVERITSEGLTDLERRRCQQRCCLFCRDPRQLNLINHQSQIRRDASEFFPILQRRFGRCLGGIL